jgi:hypothetical protein
MSQTKGGTDFYDRNTSKHKPFCQALTFTFSQHLIFRLLNLQETKPNSAIVNFTWGDDRLKSTVLCRIHHLPT